MRISSRLSLTSSIVLGMLGIMILAVMWTFHETKNAHRDDLLIIEIGKAFQQMSVLQDEYLLRQEERAEIQWRTKTEHIKKLLEQAGKQFTDIHEQMILDEIREKFDLSSFLFSSLTEYFNNTTNVKKRFFSLETQRMLSQVIVNGYNLTSATDKLRESVLKRSGATYENTTTIVIVMMVLAVLVTVGNSLSINRTLSKRIAMLSEGVKIIGNGNLDHQVAVKGNDELADLARASNTMTAKLRMSYTLMANLEKEIAERKRADEEIRQLSKFPSENPSPVMRLDRGGVVLYANEAGQLFLHEWGCAVGAHAPKSWCDLTAQVLMSGSNRVVDVEFGEKVYSFFIAPIAKADYVNLYGRDITDRKRLEEILEKEQQELKLIIDSSPIIVFYKDKEGRFIRVNKTFAEALKMPEEEFVGKTVFDLYSAKIAQGMANDDQEVLKSGRPKLNIIEQYESASGIRWVQTDKIPICDKNGIPFGLIGFAQDITARQRAEDALRQLNAELERRVAERTEQLTAVNAELEAFSYSVSHDLRAPLRAISGFTQIIARRHRANLNEEGQHYVDNIIQGSERMGQLIDDLLTYSRIGRSEIHVRPVPLGDVLTPIALDLSVSLKEIGAELNIADDLPTVYGDPTLLTQIFHNLLSNALKYHRPNVSLRVTMDAKSEGNQVVIRIADNGIGIPNEYHQKIFNVFQRLHSEDKYPGTGIGLSIVKKSVTMLGGDVWVESVVGEGSVFYVRLRKGGTV